MNPRLGWALFAISAAAAGAFYGWRGVLLAATAAVLWLLLQYGRVLGVLRQAGRAPIGSVRSAAALHAQLQPGMRLLRVVPLAGSIGLRVDPAAADGDAPSETYRWRDAGGSCVEASFEDGKLQHWQLL